eukprot:gnl/TRDRNA2_/TRDRNA2_83853_c0_seq1.p1 gnl/TRDRNA2_/TRDRNA2_83853_c0~~gnl/TRDRNA2_/TRDRNA2_83853_c0_seq1.p1  ORF type:complete len:282 (+),score=52.18 gnl/TRDRNA2_/TRDRNA2_83853_c0_seq1:66-848(+)
MAGQDAQEWMDSHQQQARPDIVPQEEGLPGVVGTKLEFFIRGFQESSFQEDVDEFVKAHAASFTVAHPDGSYPLEWTELHKQYKVLFDHQLDAMVWISDIQKGEFIEYCRRLHEVAAGCPDDAELPDVFPDDPECPNCRDIRASEFCSFLSALTASEDFDRFLRVMFDAVITQRSTASCHDYIPPEQPAVYPTSMEPPAELDTVPLPASHEIEVCVPEGVVVGQMLAVEFLGVRYELMVPEGCVPGSTFRATVALPSLST